MKPTAYIEKDNARTISGTLRPSGRFSVCQIFPRKSKVLNRETKVCQASQELHSVQELDESLNRIVNGDFSSLQNVSPSQSVSIGGVGSSIATNSDSRAKRGSKGIGARQRDILCWSANTLEKVYGRKTMSFLTLTLPELSEEDLKSIQDNWSEVVNRVVKQIKFLLEKHGSNSTVVGCTELQLEREIRTGRAFPHLHMVFRGRKDSRSHWIIEPREFREIWSRCCGGFLVARHYDWNSSENVQPVRKSCGGYLAKYISKCSSKSGGTDGHRWHPSDWILCSRALRRWYSVLTRKGYDIGRVLLQVVKDWQPGSGYKQPIVISTPAYGDRTIGQWGWLKGEEVFPTYAQLHSK